MGAEQATVVSLVPGLLLVLILTVTLIPTSALAEEFVCPPQVMTTPATLMEPLESGSPWTPYMDESGGIMIVSGMTILNGLPEDGGQPVPPQAAGEWNLANHSGALWIQCDYSGTGLRLVRPIQSGMSRCTMAVVGTLSCQ